MVTRIMLQPRSPVGYLKPQKPLCSPSETVPATATGDEEREYGQPGWGSLHCCTGAQATEDGSMHGGAHTSLKRADIQPSFPHPLQPSLTRLLDPGLTCPSPSVQSLKDGAGDWTGCPSPGPAPTAVATHTASGGEATSSRQRERWGQESWREGRRLRSPRGPGSPAGVKYQLPLDRHTLEDPGECLVGGQHTYPEKRTHTSQSTQQCTHTHMLRGPPGNCIEMCRNGSSATRRPGTHVHHVRTHTGIHTSLCLTACPSPPALAHYQSSNQQGLPGAHARCHLLTQTWQGPASMTSTIQEEV